LWGWVVDIYAWGIDAFTITFLSITLVFTWKLFSCFLQASGKDGVLTDSTSSLSLLVDATSSTKGDAHHGFTGQLQNMISIDRTKVDSVETHENGLNGK
jgi:hypothetical protein